jgi:hypothetical protein
MKSIKGVDRKLTLNRETLRALSPEELQAAAGGTVFGSFLCSVWTCAVMTCPPMTNDGCASHEARCATLTTDDNG